MAKHIIFCADGTWNGPQQDENNDHSAHPTNVFKLFTCLEGDLDAASLLDADEQEKVLKQDDTALQAAKYIHGVGDSRNALVRLLAGTFGAGVISRVVRGYTFISRNYDAGDNIHIVGFSRGAYTTRALAGMIISQGLLAKPLTVDKEQAYRKGAEVWYRYRRTSVSKPSALARLAEIVADLPAFISQNSLTEKDLVPIDRIATVAVWDTVGAMGFPEFAADGTRNDAFRFADTRLSPKVTRGLHAVAVDEQRHDFVPTLWDDAGNVTQVLFPGAHSDVGGGYPMTKGESGLSDNALQWVTDKLSAAGVCFCDPLPVDIKPDPAGVAHKPWKHFPFNLATLLPDGRDFPPTMARDPFIAKRMAAGPVVAEPDEAPGPYKPANLD